jgi:hypothetical protein
MGTKRTIRMETRKTRSRVTDETHEMWIIRTRAWVYRVEEDIFLRSSMGPGCQGLNVVSTAQAMKMPETFEGHVSCILAEARLSDNDAQIHKMIVSRIDNVRTEDKNKVIQTRERRDWQDCPQTKKVRDYAVQSQPK